MASEESELWSSGPGLIEALWRYKRLIAITVIAFAAAGYGLSFLLPTVYQGTATVILSDPRNAGVFRETTQLIIDPNRYVRNQAERIASLRVLERASEIDGRGLSASTIQASLSASPAQNLDQITVSATDSTPEGAASLANAVVAAYEQIVVEDVGADADAALEELDRSRAELQSRLAVLEAELEDDPGDAATRSERDATISRINTLRDRAEQITVDAALYGSGVEVFDEAIVPGAPSSPNKTRNALIAAFLGLIGASAFAWWRAEQAQTADDRHDAAAIVRAPLLGEVFEFASAELDEKDAVFMPGSQTAEAYQFVFASLDFALGKDSITVAITSADQGDGKTTSSLNIAGAAAQTERSVLLVDGDERMRGLTHLATEILPAPGLTDLVAGRADLDACTRPWSMADGVSVAFIPGGSPLSNPAGFFSTASFRDAMADIRKAADLVFVDTPPVLAVADASAIAARADGIVLVVNKGVPLKRLQEVRDRLDSVGTPLLGYVFNRSDATRARYRYGFGYRNKLGRYVYGYGSRTAPNGDRFETPQQRERQEAAKEA